MMIADGLCTNFYRYLTISAVSKLCEIELDLSDFDMSQFDKTINPLSITREMVYKFGYKYEIKFDDEMGYMSVRTICQGREIGKTSLKFEGQED